MTLREVGGGEGGRGGGGENRHRKGKGRSQGEGKESGREIRSKRKEGDERVF